MIDYQRLLDLMGGDRGLADQLIQSFKDDAGQLLDKISSYLHTSEYELLSNTAHILKTQAGYLGLENLQELSRSIEYQSLHDPSMDELKKKVQDLHEMMHRILSDEAFNT